MKEPVYEKKWWFVLLFLLLLSETVLSLLMPEILSVYIDNLEIKGDIWLVSCALGYCFSVFIRGCVSTCNTYISESLGWKLCDHLRVDLFKRIFNFNVQYHKSSQEGGFLERIEGDVNFLIGFFSSMMVDIFSSALMVIGILFVFYIKYAVLGLIFTVLSLVIIVMFMKSQNWISDLWKNDRGQETDVLDDFSQAVAAQIDIWGVGKQEYIKEKLSDKFLLFEKTHVKASFLGNIPSTIFFSLLNVGEGIALAFGIYLLRKGNMTIGEIYLILSYVVLLNMPFFSLKYEFAQMPKVLTSLTRINDFYEMDHSDLSNGDLVPGKDNSVAFYNVSFRYQPDTLVLNGVSFEIASGEHLAITGRTGSGKSTVLQLIAGFYTQEAGEILVGGRHISEYRKEEYNRFLYYILQNNPILEDTVRNNVTRYDERFSDKEICEALSKVNMREWLDRKENGLDEIMNPENTSQDEAQLLAWAGAILRKPGILLVDEFDAVIHEDTIKVINQIVLHELNETTIVLVTHQNRSDIHIHASIVMENGRII